MNHAEEEIVIHDNGGTRSGQERRQNSKSYKGAERRSARDRRRGFDRRNGLARRRTPNGINNNYQFGNGIERRDVFRG